MNRTVRENIKTAYSLHDMNVIEFEVKENDIIMRTQSGIVKTVPPYSQPEGYVEFHNVQWDFSLVYLIDWAGNTGRFTGEKIYLKDFISRFKCFGFEIIDQTYGYNQTKYSGYLTSNKKFYECMIEIYHEGDMVFVAEA